MDSNLIQVYKNSWRNCNNATVAFATSTTLDLWNKKPFDKRFTTYSWEYACLLRTRMCYLTGLKTGKLTFSHQNDIPDKSEVEKYSKNEVIEGLKEYAKLILEQIEKINTTQQLDLVNWLLQHERIHQGKLVLYHSQLGIKIPDSFKKTWGESNFSKTSKG
jgi:hypothetical protein